MGKYLWNSLTPSCTVLSPRAGHTWEVLKLFWDLRTYLQGLSTGLEWKKSCKHAVSHSVPWLGIINNMKTLSAAFPSSKTQS